MAWEDVRGQEIFDDFRGRKGSYQIGSAYALSAILREVGRSTPTRVLELGPGIGATTRALVDGLDRSVGGGWELVTVEVNEFCRGELASNLGADAERVRIVADGADVPHDQPFDFVLIDGPGSIRDHVEALSPRAVVFVENLRIDQRAELDAVLPTPWASRSSWPVLTTERLGGYHVYQLRPTAAERATFAAKANGQKVANRLRPIARRVFAKVGLGSIMDRCAERADRGRITEAEHRDATVAHDER